MPACRPSLNGTAPAQAGLFPSRLANPNVGWKD
jgi:hypothetical protein